MKKLIRILASALSVFILTGCASIVLHQEEEFGHPYAGFQNSVTTAPCNVALTGTVLFIYAPIFIADIPLSFVADTLYLPWDIYREPEQKRGEVTYSVVEYCKMVADGMQGKKGSEPELP